MKVILLRDQRILHKAGDIVEVSPEVYAFLISVGNARAVKEAPQTVKQEEAKPAAKRRTTKKG